jgi:hypothetical protein
MTLLKNDPLTQLAFSLYENKGVFAMLLGSGLSRSAEIPTGWEITLDLVRRVGLAQGVEEPADWAQWYRDKTGQEPNYSALLEEIASSPDERRAILHRYIEPNEEDREEGRKIPTPAHHAIAKLVRSGHIRVIITTNFDRLMENALREQGVEPTVISSVDSLGGAEPLTHSRCYLLKLHGDYKDARILNTDQELSAYPDEYNKLLDRILDEHGLVVCGWSGEWDHALRAGFLRAPNRRYAVYWVTRGEYGAGALELANHRQARKISTTGADEFFKSLLQRVETLEESQRQNPLSVDLLVNATKRFLSKSEYRIQLDELIASEVGRLIEQIDTPEFAAQGQFSQEMFQTRVHRYEALTEPLARMAGVLGRWGDGQELPLVIDILRSSLHGHAERVGSGLTVLLGLRSYPAFLVFTAYGLGLTRSQRWKTLHELFTASWPRDYREPKTVLSTFFFDEWKGSDINAWKLLKGFDRRRTPLNDHVLEVMDEWRLSFSNMTADFELDFERFEMLGALVSLEENSEESLEQSMTSNPTQIFAHMAVGRIGWDEVRAKRLIQDLKAEVAGGPLLGAGFGKNSQRFVELYIANFLRYAARMSW